MWAWFRNLPRSAQVAGWLLLSPIVLSAWIWSRDTWSRQWRFIGVVAVAFATVVIATSGNAPSTPQPAPPIRAEPSRAPAAHPVHRAAPARPSQADREAALDKKRLAALRLNFRENFGYPDTTPTWYVPPRDLSLAGGELTASTGWSNTEAGRALGLDLCQALRYNYWPEKQYGVDHVTVLAPDSSVLAVMSPWSGKCEN